MLNAKSFLFFAVICLDNIYFWLQYLNSLDNPRFVFGHGFLVFSSALVWPLHYDLGVMAQFPVELTSASYFSPINVSSHVKLTSGHPAGHLAQNKGS